MNKVLVLSHSEDPHADSVCEYFEEKAIDFFRIDTEAIIDRYDLSFDLRTGYYLVESNARSAIIDETWTIWNRRVADPNLPEGFPKDLEKIVLAETNLSWRGLLFTHRGKVVNKPQAEFAASNKIDQLLFARSYGTIETPDTLLTNDPETLAEFYKNHRRVCHKLQKAALVERDEKPLTVYTSIVNHENMAHADLIRLNPSLFQEYIEKLYELRITVLSDRAVAVAIHSQDSELSRHDFRKYDFKNVRYEKVELPQDVEKFCVDMARHYRLHFCEIDMIYSQNRTYVFLELNPNGQWLWLEERSGYNLTKDVAENILR